MTDSKFPSIFLAGRQTTTSGCQSGSLGPIPLTVHVFPWQACLVLPLHSLLLVFLALFLSRDGLLRVAFPCKSWSWGNFLPCSCRSGRFFFMRNGYSYRPLFLVLWVLSAALFVRDSLNAFWRTNSFFCLQLKGADFPMKWFLCSCGPRCHVHQIPAFPSEMCGSRFR